MIQSSARQPFPHTIRGGQIYVVPTRMGLLFVGLLFVMLLVSVNNNNNLGYLLTFFMASLYLVSIFHTFENLRGLTITAASAEPTYAGRSATFEIVMRASRTEHCNIILRIDGGPAATATAIQGEAATVEVVKQMERRGIYEVQQLTVGTTYPFGLIRARAHLTPELACLVYPKPAPNPTFSRMYTSPSQDSGGESVGAGSEDFDTLRDYVPGDPMSLIHWKAISKGQGMQAKQFEGESGGTYLFDYNHVPGTAREQKLSYLCALVLRAEREKKRYALSIPGTCLPPALGYAHHLKCLEALARM